MHGRDAVLALGEHGDQVSRAGIEAQHGDDVDGELPTDVGQGLPQQRLTLEGIGNVAVKAELAGEDGHETPVGTGASSAHTSLPPSSSRSTPQAGENAETMCRPRPLSFISPSSWRSGMP